MIKITECPRDAMQGIGSWIPTSLKTEYLNALLGVGFDILDFGSFVSPKAVPQLRDTSEVLLGLDMTNTNTKLLAIIANYRGAKEVVKHPEIHFLGYPLSVSETFQQKNTGKSTAESIELVTDIQQLAADHGKELLIYFSMGFGNPYGDPYSESLIKAFTDQVVSLGVRHIRLADTVGNASPGQIRAIMEPLIASFPDTEIGAHFHAPPNSATSKIAEAWQAGCRMFDVALGGFGGCPFAKDELVGNLSTELLLEWASNNQIGHQLDISKLNEAQALVHDVFNR